MNPLKTLFLRIKYFVAFANKRLLILGGASFLIVGGAAGASFSSFGERFVGPSFIGKVVPAIHDAVTRADKSGGSGNRTQESSSADTKDSSEQSSATPDGAIGSPTSDSGGSTITPGSPTSPTNPTLSPGGSLKPYPIGLITTDPTTINLYPYATFVTIKSVSWQDVEPSPGNYNWSSIDGVISATRAKNPHAKFRIRLYAGRQAPDWVKDVSGGCVQVDPDSPNGASGCVPRFWTEPYINRYEILMDAFAAKYEGNAAVIDLVNSACSTIFAESFILGADGTSVDRLWQAGLTEAGHRNCLNRTTAKMMQVFPSSQVTIAGHDKWQIVVQGPNGTGDGKREDSWEKERDILNGWRTSYGGRLVIEEHGLGPTDYCAPGQNILTASSFYCWFASLSGPKGLQFTLNGGSMEQAATNGVNMGACFLEYAAFQAIAEPRRQEIHNQLLANCD